MSSSNDPANREVGQESFILQAMQQYFARLEVPMNNIGDRIEQNEEVLRRVLPQTQRQERRVSVTLNHEGLADELGDEEGDPIEEVGRMAPRRIRQGQGIQRDLIRREEVDRHLGNIKIKIPSFQGRNDPEAYLEWEKKVEMAFDCHHYSEENKVKLEMVGFTDYAIVWWDQLVTNQR